MTEQQELSPCLSYCPEFTLSFPPLLFSLTFEGNVYTICTHCGSTIKLSLSLQLWDFLFTGRFITVFDSPSSAHPGTHGLLLCLLQSPLLRVLVPFFTMSSKPRETRFHFSHAYAERKCVTKLPSSWIFEFKWKLHHFQRKFWPSHFRDCCYSNSGN